MSEKFRLDRKIGFQNTFYTKCINVIVDSIGPSIILRSIVTSTNYKINLLDTCDFVFLDYVLCLVIITLASYTLSYDFCVTF